MPLNSKETWKGYEQKDKHHHVLNFGTLPDAPLEHPRECESERQDQANLPEIQS